MSAFRDMKSRFADKNAQVLGVSMDDLDTQKRFAQSLDLPFPLGADPKGQVAEAYGVRNGSYANRVTFVIDGDGQVLKVIEGRDALDPTAAVEACPLHPSIPKEARKTPRHGCDAPVQARSEHRVASGRLLDVSAGGARILGADGFAAGDCVELRLLAPDGPTFHDLSYALVVWVADGQMGVQFDRSDIVGRHAVARLLTRNEELWDSAWEGLHPPACCVGGGGVMDPEPPRLERRTG